MWRLERGEKEKGVQSWRVDGGQRLKAALS